MSQNQKRSLGSDNFIFQTNQTTNTSSKNMTNSNLNSNLNSTNSNLNSTNSNLNSTNSNLNSANLNQNSTSSNLNSGLNELADFVQNRSLDLRWQTKNRIVNHLVSHNALLYKNIHQIDNNEINNIIDEAYLIFRILMNLPKATDKLKGEKSIDPLNRFKRIKLEKDEEKSEKITEKLDSMDKQKEDNQVKKDERKLDERKLDERKLDDEIILDLSWGIRDLLVNHLLRNHHISILYSHEIPRSIKKLLIQENNDLINTLTTLSVRNEGETSDENTNEISLLDKISEKQAMSTNQSVYEIKEDIKKELLQHINAGFKKN